MKFEEVSECRCCGSKVSMILDLKNQPLANSYHPKNEVLDEFPLSLNLCPNCYHMQLGVVVNPEIMFKHYLYVSGTSETLKSYFDFFARFTVERFKNYNSRPPANVLDIACNDGSQLDAYKKIGIRTYGVDPAENLHELSKNNHEVVCDFFPSRNLTGLYDLITAQNVFAHTHDIFGFLTSAKKLLSEQGVIFIQTSQANMIQNNEFDTAYHEHLSFFNSLSMKTLVDRCGLSLNNIFKFDIHGTSYVFEVARDKIDTNIDSVIRKERKMGMYRISSYKKFAKNAKKITLDLKNTVLHLRKEGFRIIGYGAAAKGMTVLNFGQINLDLIIDDNKMKHGLLTPGMNIPITESEVLKKFTEEEKIAFIPLAWNFYDEIYRRIIGIRKCEKDVFVKYFPEISVTT